MSRGFIAGLTLGCLAAADACAGAWPQPTGAVQIIVTASRKVAPAGSLLGSGEIESDTNSTSILVEYGATEDLTVGVTAYGKLSATNANDYELRLGGHVRYRFWSGEDGDVGSFQLGTALPAERWLGDGLGDNRPDSVPEIRADILYGRGWQSDWGNSFVSAGLGFLYRGEGKPDEVRFDLTAGHEPWRGVLGLMSVYATQPLGGGEASSVKLSPSLAYTLWPWLGDNDKKPRGPLRPRTIQLGVTWDAAAPGEGIEPFLGIWQRF